MQKLYKKPIANIIKNNWTDLSGLLTLDKINEKLNSGVYASLFDLFLDLRLLLEQRDPQNPANTNTNIILEDITNWITHKFHNMPRSQEEYDYIKIHKLIKKINFVFNAMILKLESSETTIDLSGQSVLSPKMPQAGQKRLEVLQQRIEHLRTPEELQAVLRILQKHIPQFTLAPEVVIEGRYITKACANDLRDYLNSVNA